jgi:hypothetical protein
MDNDNDWLPRIEIELSLLGVRAIAQPRDLDGDVGIW